MTAPEVQHTLDAIQSNYGTPLADIPLERVDRDNSDLLDDTPVHKRAADLKAMNYVGASLVDRATDVVGTEYDHRVETVVGVRVEGMHASEWGGIDPNAGTADAVDNIDHPVVQWDALVETIRRAVLTERAWPSVGRANVGYKDLKIANETDASSDWADYYRYDFDAIYSGFETLPDP
jgi:hypothetical protein